MRARTVVFIVASLVSLLLAFSPDVSASDPTPSACTWADVVYIVDGDTIDVEIGETRYRVRYIGMDTAERGQPCYDEGKWENRSLVEDQTVCLDKDVSETDRYGRLLRYVYVGDVMVNAELIRRGVASAATYPPDVRFSEWFVQLEREAREEGRGCWADTLSRIWLPIVVGTNVSATCIRM